MTFGMVNVLLYLSDEPSLVSVSVLIVPFGSVMFDLTMPTAMVSVTFALMVTMFDVLNVELLIGLTSKTVGLTMSLTVKFVIVVVLKLFDVSFAMNLIE